MQKKFMYLIKKQNLQLQTNIIIKGVAIAAPFYALLRSGLLRVLFKEQSQKELKIIK